MWHEKCVVILYKIFFWKFCLSCSNTLKYYYKHTEGLHVNCLIFLSDFNKTCNFLTDLNKSICLQNFVRWERSCFMRADGQTRQYLMVAFLCFSNMPHKHVLLKPIKYRQRNRDRVVGVGTRPRVRWAGVRIPKKAKVFFPPKSSILTLGSTQPPIQCLTGFFPGSKAGNEVDHSPSSGAEFNKEWSYTSILPYDSMQRIRIIFIPYP
jgi:hypothetical protein